MFLTVRRIFTVCACILLILLFLLPIRYLNDTAEGMRRLIEKARDALNADDFDSAGQTVAALTGLYDQRGEKLKLFLNHSAVDAAELCFDIAAEAVAVQDKDSALYALTEGACALNYLLSIETFTPDSIL